MTIQEIIKTVKYLNFCGLCTTGDCKNCARKIAKDKVLSLLELEREMIDEKKLIEDIKEWSNEREIKWTSESIINLLESAHKISNWILCSERLPEEHDSIFAKFKGTDKWNASMYEKISDDVNVTVEFEDGKRKTMTLHTCDGKWKTDIRIVKFNVVAWQSLPDTYLE